jgi:hypothetical protein
MESHCSFDSKFESNFHIHLNLPPHSVLHLVPMRLINNHKTSSPVRELAITWWFRSGR